MTSDVSMLFAQLALRPDATERDVRRAYAAELKKIDQAAQPEAFQELRETYERLMAWLRRQAPSMPEQQLQSLDEVQAVPQAGGPISEEPVPIERPDVSPAATPRTVDSAPMQSSPQSHEEPTHEMLQLLTRALETQSLQHRDAYSDLLKQCLQDQRLAHVDARHFFELGVAQILASGWRPGHDLLFAPAITCFGWQTDRAHLSSLGRAGVVIEAAIAELAVFDGQQDFHRRNQRDVIRALRSGDPQRHVSLSQQIETAGLLIANFPHWLHVISRPRIVQEWRDRLVAVESQRRAAQARDKPRNLFLLYMHLAAVVVIAIVAGLTFLLR